MKEVIKIKCNECPYFSGVQCHGHGDYWATCEILKDKKFILKKLFEKRNTYLSDLDVWSDVRSEKSTCRFFELHKYSED